jgi:hypothetical protein
MLVNVLTWTSLAMSGIAFLVFVILSIRSAGRKTGTPDAGQNDGRRDGTISDITKLTEAVAKMAESFTKAGPALSALVASILYLLIATMGAGLDKLSQH